MEDLIRKMTDLKTLSPEPCKDEEEKFRKFLEKTGRASSYSGDVTFETDETFSVKSMASSSTRVNRQRSEESTQNVVVAIQRRGIGRGYGFGRREESKNSSIVDDLQNFLSKM